MNISKLSEGPTGCQLESPFGVAFGGMNMISDSEREWFSQDFVVADVGKTGYIGGAEARLYFQASGLPRQTLALIW
jgi:hypothetical protein